MSNGKPQLVIFNSAAIHSEGNKIDKMHAILCSKIVPHYNVYLRSLEEICTIRFPFFLRNQVCLRYIFPFLNQMEIRKHHTILNSSNSIQICVSFSSVWYLYSIIAIFFPMWGQGNMEKLYIYVVSLNCIVENFLQHWKFIIIVTSDDAIKLMI